MNMHRLKRFYLQAALLIVLISSAWAGPAEYVVRGRVLEKGTRKPLGGITVYALDREAESALSEPDGRFALSVGAPGEFSLVGTGVGYTKSEPVKVTVGPQGESKEATLYLAPAYSMVEVVVLADRNLDKTGKTVISGKELVSVPGSGGDPLRGMQALPGITTGSDLSSNPAIRGSGPQDNAYYVDFLPVGYLFHMGGIVSVLNADLVEDFNIYSSAFGPEFADVTGAVIDVKLRDPRKDRLGGKVNVSTLEAGALIEGPVAPNQSFYFAGRRSYIDLFLPEIGELNKGINYRQFPQYYDYQGKYLWNISEDHSLALQFSGANDSMKLTFTDESDAVKQDPILAGDFNLEMSYHAQGAVLASRLSPRVNNRLGVTYLSNAVTQQLTQLGHVNVYMNDIFVRDHLTVAGGERHDFLVGMEYGVTNVRLDLDTVKEVPSIYDADTDLTSSERFVNKDRFSASWWGLALKDRWKIFDPFTFIIGGRTTHEDYFGKYLVEPRLGAEYQATADTLVTAGWGKYHQFPQGFEVIEGMGNPDLDYVKADHYDLGVERQLGRGWSAKVDTYYKKLYDLIVPHQPENFVNGGSGNAYGAELLIKKNRTTDWWGWLSIGYSRTERKNDLTGESFPYPYDQPLIVNLVYERRLSQKWTFAARWRYQSGAPFTPVIGTDGTYPDGRPKPKYGPLGSERLPDYHRLDVRFTREYLFNTWKMGLYLDIINVYARNNVSGYQYNADYSSREPVTQLPFLPSLGITAEF